MVRETNLEETGAYQSQLVGLQLTLPFIFLIIGFCFVYTLLLFLTHLTARPQDLISSHKKEVPELARVAPKITPDGSCSFLDPLAPSL